MKHDPVIRISSYAAYHSADLGGSGMKYKHSRAATYSLIA